jgi:HAE1 family hydrophobic/amphiphilic exporter-1
MNISRFAVHRPVTTAMIYIAVTLLGLFALGRLAIDLIPELAFPSLSISTSYSGVAPEEIESLITIPIEQAVSTVSGVVSMDSLSREGSSRVTLGDGLGGGGQRGAGQRGEGAIPVACGGERSVGGAV